MKKWKKQLSLVIAVVMLFGVLSISASAAGAEDTTATTVTTNFESKADILKDMGLFLGTPSGYQLDRVPTRVEAATMLVRLLGAEPEASNGTYKHDFTDVPSWADKTMGYLFEKGLAKGTSPGKYTSAAPCQAIMYFTFILRALGYDDTKGDFEYTKAVEAAEKYGVIDKALAEFYTAKESFLRDDLVGISYYALAAKIKGDSGKILLDKLVDDKALTAATADKYRGPLDGFAMYNTLSKAETNTMKHATGSIKADVKITTSAGAQNSSVEYTYKIKNADDPAKLEMEMVGKSKQPGVADVETKSYVKEGWVYVSAGTSKIKQEFISAAESMGTDPMDPIGGLTDGLLLPPEIVSFTKNKDNTSTMVMKIPADQFNSIMAMFSALSESEFGLDEDMSITYTISDKNVVTGATVSMKSEMNVKDETTGVTEKIAMEITMAMTIALSETAPTITFPDFKDYVELAI